MNGYQLTPEMCAISLELEKRWMGRIEELESSGISCGDTTYDYCAANLSAIDREFNIDDSDGQ